MVRARSRVITFCANDSNFRRVGGIEAVFSGIGSCAGPARILHLKTASQAQRKSIFQQPDFQSRGHRHPAARHAGRECRGPRCFTDKTPLSAADFLAAFVATKELDFLPDVARLEWYWLCVSCRQRPGCSCSPGSYSILPRGIAINSRCASNELNSASGNAAKR